MLSGRNILAGLTGVLLLGSAFVCCSGDDGTTGGGGSGAGLGLGGTGGGLLACDPPCAEPQFCSVSGVCLDEGYCAADED